MNTLRGNMASQERTCACIIRCEKQAKAWRWNKLKPGLLQREQEQHGCAWLWWWEGLSWGVRGDLVLEMIASKWICSVYPSELSGPSTCLTSKQNKTPYILSRISIGRFFLWVMMYYCGPWKMSCSKENTFWMPRSLDSVSKAKGIDKRT